jgi:predicted DNA-binding transcriptional regulator AlpA
MPPKVVDDLLTPEETAEKLRIKVRTLKDWRVQGRGPRAMRYGNFVRYKVSDVQEWIDAHVEGVSRT